MEESKKPYFDKLISFLESERANATIFPPPNLIFNIFNSCPVENVSIVVLGQDPYHGKGQAMGMSFSVQTGVTVPPSLRVHIYFY